MWLFFLGFLWFFLVSMQTRIIAFTDNFLFHAGWTFTVSIVWIYLIRKVILSTELSEILLYAFGTALGSVTATLLHSRWKKEQKPIQQ